MLFWMPQKCFKNVASLNVSRKIHSKGKYCRSGSSVLPKCFHEFSVLRDNNFHFPCQLLYFCTAMLEAGLTRVKDKKQSPKPALKSLGLTNFKGKKMKKILAVIFASAVISGCASVGAPINQKAADQIQEGVTTKDQVAILMGQPYQISRLPNGESAYMYIYSKVSAKASSFIPIVGALVGGSKVDSQNLIVTFNKDGIVKAVTGSQTSASADSNLSAGATPTMPTK